MIDWDGERLSLDTSEGPVLVFADDVDPQRFHYLPGRPRWRRGPDGAPELRVVRHQVPAELEPVLGGGFLSGVVELGLSEEGLRRTRSALLNRLGLPAPPTLGPVLPDIGRARFYLLDAAGGAEGGEGGRLVPRLLGEATPGLAAGWLVSFTAVLDPAGIGVVESLVRQGELPLSVVWELDVPGLQPALRATVEVDETQVYDFLERRLHGGQLLLAVDVGPTFEALSRSGAIRVTVDELLPEHERTAAWRRVIDRVTEDLSARFLVPVLGTTPMPAGDPGGSDLRRMLAGLVGAFTIELSLRDVHRSELRQARFDLRVGQVQRRTLSPQGLVDPLRRPDSPWDPEPLLLDLGPLPDPDLDFEIGSAEDLTDAGIDRVELRLVMGEREHRATLSAAEPLAHWRVRYDPTTAGVLRRSATVHFRADLPGVVQAELPLRSSAARVLRLLPSEAVERVDTHVRAPAAALQRGLGLLVDLRVEGGELRFEDTFELTAASLAVDWCVRMPRGASPLRLGRARWVESDGAVRGADWLELDDSFWAVPDPEPDLVDVLLFGAARFGDTVARIAVELHVDARPEEVALRVLDKANPSAIWSFRVGEGAAGRAWSWRASIQGTHGDLQAPADWQPGDGARLVVGPSVHPLREVRLHLLGPPFSTLGLMGVKIRCEALDAAGALLAEQEDLVTAPGPFAFAYPAGEAAGGAWRYTLTRYGEDGRQAADSLVDTTEAVAVVPLRALPPVNP